MDDNNNPVNHLTIEVDSDVDCVDLDMDALENALKDALDGSSIVITNDRNQSLFAMENTSNRNLNERENTTIQTHTFVETENSEMDNSSLTTEQYYDALKMKVAEIRKKPCRYSKKEELMYISDQKERISRYGRRLETLLLAVRNSSFDLYQKPQSHSTKPPMMTFDKQFRLCFRQFRDTYCFRSILCYI